MGDNKESNIVNKTNGSNEKEWREYKRNLSTEKKSHGIYQQKKIDLSYLESLYNKGVAHGVAGSQNLGNTCFMNSSIQCFSNSIDLTAYFLSKEYKKDINTSSKFGLGKLLSMTYNYFSGGSLADSWYDVLSNLWEKRVRDVNTRDFKVAIAKKAKMFSGYSQHDSNEFMTFFLDYICEDLNRVSVKPYRELEEQGDNEDDFEAAQRYWQMHLDRNNSIITDLFTGQFKSTIECPECKWVSKTYDPFNTLSLPIPKLKNINIYFLPKYGIRKTVKFSLRILPNSLFGDLSHIIKTSHNLEAAFEQLRFMIISDQEMIKLALPKDNIENIDDSYIFCCDTDSKIEGKLMNLPIYFSVNGEISAHPRLLSITKTMTYSYLKKLIYYYARRFITLPIDETAYETETKTLAEEYTKGSDDLINICTIEYERLFNSKEEEKTKEIIDFIDNFPYKLYLEKGNQMRLIFGNPSKSNDKIEIKDDTQVISDLYDLIKDKWRFVLLFDKNNSYFRQDSVVKMNQCKSLESKQKEVEVSLSDCLEYFQLTEKLGKDNEWYCKKCKKHQPAHKKMELFYMPKLLIIHLKRFTSSRYHSEKIGTLVDFPINDLDMSNFVVGHILDNLKYDLYAVSQHYGGCGGGHYTAICKNNEQWYTYNDSSVSHASENAVVSSAAYVLFYRRKDI